MRRKIRRLQRCKATPILAFPRLAGEGTDGSRCEYFGFIPEIQVNIKHNIERSDGSICHYHVLTETYSLSRLAGEG